MKKLILLLPFGLMACQTTTEPARVLYPVERCGYVDVPEYGILDRPTSDGEIIGGVVIGGLIGNQLSDNDPAATIVGSLLGGAIVSDNRVQEPVVTGHHQEWRCQTTYE